MKTIKILLVLVIITFFSCKKDIKSGLHTVNVETLDSVKSTKNSTNKNKSIYTKYEYIYSESKSLIIQNSFPKGGMRYKAPNGKEYIYAVFWTRIINKTPDAVDFKIDFPLNSYEIPTLPVKYYKILIPSDTMTLDKIPLFNYGLTNLESFFDKNIDKPSSLKRSIKPKESTGFYVVTLRLMEGTQYGILRTEFTLKGKNLFYKIRDKEIKCGSIEKK